MFSFKGFITKDKNTHLEHLEDDIINRGSKGGENAVNFLKSIRNMLAGSAGSQVNMTVKWDGAPAIICGIDRFKYPKIGKPIVEDGRIGDWYLIKGKIRSGFRKVHIEKWRKLN